MFARMVLHMIVQRFFKLNHCIERKVEGIILLKITCGTCSINPSIMVNCLYESYSVEITALRRDCTIT